ncbi:MAG: hypothetical protein VKK42_27095 [Lyngbya sp.]|nr:hypothetical protein [Lyngbya sp.]
MLRTGAIASNRHRSPTELSCTRSPHRITRVRFERSPENAIIFELTRFRLDTLLYGDCQLSNLVDLSYCSCGSWNWCDDLRLPGCG